MNLARDQARLVDVDAGLVSSYFAIAPEFEKAFPGSSLTIPTTGGYRPLAMQQSVHLSGASAYTGLASFSKHQAWPAAALDWEVLNADGTAEANGEDPRYVWVGAEFERRGFLWGGHFVHRPDWDHVEIRGPQPTEEQVRAGFEAYKASVLGTA